MEKNNKKRGKNYGGHGFKTFSRTRGTASAKEERKSNKSQRGRGLKTSSMSSEIIKLEVKNLMSIIASSSMKLCQIQQNLRSLKPLCMRNCLWLLELTQDNPIFKKWLKCLRIQGFWRNIRKSMREKESSKWGKHNINIPMSLKKWVLIPLNSTARAFIHKTWFLSSCVQKNFSKRTKG